MNVNLRPLTVDELELLFAWRKIPEIWEYMPSYDRLGLTWAKHYTWFKSRSNRKDWIIYVDDKSSGRRIAVGCTHVEFLDTNAPEIGIFIADEDLRGKGVGYQALKWTMEDIMKKRVHKEIFAVIHPGNIRSIHLFHKVGFEKVGGGGSRNGQDLYKCTFGRPEVPVPVSKVRDRRSP